jgi:hypothetical protein
MGMPAMLVMDQAANSLSPSAMLAQQVTETRAVQHGAGPDDASARPAGPFVGDIRQDVHRIAYDQNHRRRLLEHDFINDIVDDFDIALKQLQPRFARPLFGPGRNHNQVRIRIIRRLGLMNLDGREKRLAMDQIEDLPQGQFMVGIAQGNLIGQTALGQRIGKGGTHGARANNHHFSRFPRFIIHFFAPPLGHRLSSAKETSSICRNQRLKFDMLQRHATGTFHLGRKTSNRKKYFSSPLLIVNPAGSFHTASRLVGRQRSHSMREDK